MNKTTGNYTTSATGAHFQSFMSAFEDTFWSWSTPDYEPFDMVDKWQEYNIRANITPELYKEEGLGFN